MKRQTVLVSVVVAVLVGIVQTDFLLFCWAYIGAYSPLGTWLIHLGLRGFALRTVLFPVDFLTSVVLSIPAALALLKLCPKKLWPYLLLAVVPSFIWLNWGFIGDPLFARLAGSIALGWLPELFALPIAVWLMRFLLRPRAGSNSSQSPDSRLSSI